MNTPGNDRKDRHRCGTLPHENLFGKRGQWQFKSCLTATLLNGHGWTASRSAVDGQPAMLTGLTEVKLYHR
jgi:hypothetical protein